MADSVAGVTQPKKLRVDKKLPFQAQTHRAMLTYRAWGPVLSVTQSGRRRLTRDQLWCHHMQGQNSNWSRIVCFNLVFQDFWQNISQSSRVQHILFKTFISLKLLNVYRHISWGSHSYFCPRHLKHWVRAPCLSALFPLLTHTSGPELIRDHRNQCSHVCVSHWCCLAYRKLRIN